jgi:hypothetical protein
MHMTIERLMAMMPPPVTRPTAVPWHLAPGEVGFQFPDDYRDFTDLYGSGRPASSGTRSAKEMRVKGLLPWPQVHPLGWATISRSCTRTNRMRIRTPCIRTREDCLPGATTTAPTTSSGSRVIRTPISGRSSPGTDQGIGIASTEGSGSSWSRACRENSPSGHG